MDIAWLSLPDKSVQPGTGPEYAKNRIFGKLTAEPGQNRPNRLKLAINWFKPVLRFRLVDLAMPVFSVVSAGAARFPIVVSHRMFLFDSHMCGEKEKENKKGDGKQTKNAEIQLEKIEVEFLRSFHICDLSLMETEK